MFFNPFAFRRGAPAPKRPQTPWARWGRWAVAICLSAYLLSGAFDCLDVKEPLTGASFPSHIGKQHLVATGVRRKFGQLKVYAVALYLDKSSKLWSDPPPTLKRFLKDAPGRCSLRMVITSSLVTKHKLAEGLRESLKPRLLERLKSHEAEEVLEAFATALADGPALKRGTQLLFTLQQGNIHLQMGKYVAEVKGKALVEALLATYVDSKAVAPEFKEAIFKGLTRSL
eukprot:symbB.v1.2.011103.t1/scaffold729.1/size168447/6